MAAYKRAIRQEMGKARQYPDYARRMGYSGRMVILVSMSAGQVNAELKGKSPHQELDEMGMKMVDFAIHRVPLPDALKNTVASFDVPILFQLIDLYSKAHPVTRSGLFYCISMDAHKRHAWLICY